MVLKSFSGTAIPVCVNFITLGKILNKKTMKKQILFVGLGLGALVACQPTRRATISGTLSGVESDTLLVRFILMVAEMRGTHGYRPDERRTVCCRRCGRQCTTDLCACAVG